MTTSSTSTAPVTTPAEFICPLSHQLMKDPVVSIHGETFEREAIIRWFEMDNDYCPFSGKPMSLRDIIPNVSLRTKLQMWIDQNGLATEDEGDASSSEDLDTAEEERAYMRKRGIFNEIEIDSEDFRSNIDNPKDNDENDGDEPPIKEIQTTSPTTKKRFGKIPSISKALFRLGAKAA